MGGEGGAKVGIPSRTVTLSRRRGHGAEARYLVAGRVLTRVKNTDGSTSTCSPRDRFL